MVLKLKVVLRNVLPQVWRRLRVPTSFTLADLHLVLQVAMGWESAHFHRFTVGGVTYTEQLPEDPDRRLSKLFTRSRRPRLRSTPG
jgi:hypothetical protein